MVCVQLRADGVAIGYTKAGVAGRPNVVEVESEQAAQAALGKRRVGDAWVTVEVVSAPKPLDGAALIDLCQDAGGMTNEHLVAAYESPALKPFVIKLQASSRILPGDDRVGQGLAALEMLGYLPAGAAAVFAAWPKA